MNISTVADNRVFLRLFRPFRCTFFCLQRPVLMVSDPAGNVIGSVHNPWSVGLGRPQRARCRWRGKDSRPPDDSDRRDG